MIAGRATAAATAELADRRPDLAFTRLGRSGLTVSRAGFGGYRIASGVAHHRQALETALLGGINLIDTSANYADGASETLVGEVVAHLAAQDRLSRAETVVVSKVGYLQGNNYALSRQREAAGNPFPERVPYGEGIEHCIHPEFIADQLTRSLSRLQMDALDIYLLHNPEYYLGWAAKNGIALDTARSEYYRRLEAAFRYLETEVAAGRIGCYGVSSNTFPSPADEVEFTSLNRVWQIADRVRPDHHLAVVQMPMNLLESGAALEPNQPGPQTVLALAHQHDLGVMINRPLNAFAGNRMCRLAEVPAARRQATNTIIAKIRTLVRMEKRLWHGLLPQLPVPPGIVVRIKEQIAIGDLLKHHWQNFGDYEYWRHTHTNVIAPRVQGVVDYLTPMTAEAPDLAAWLEDHRQALSAACGAVASIYAEKAGRQVQRVHQAVGASDADWDRAETLSQKAIRAVRSTYGVSTVLVGMRRPTYVADVLSELKRPIDTTDRQRAWQRLHSEVRSALV
jgi:aryl-alcohol dehydrogenase-like predicted oxidoreductase